MGISSAIANSLKKIEEGSTYDVDYNTTNSPLDVVWVDVDKAVVFYKETYLKAKVVTVNSDNSLSFGSETTIDSSAKDYARAIYCPSQDKILCIYGGNNDGTSGMYRKAVTVSGTSLSLGSRGTIYSESSFITNVDLAYDPVLEAVHISYLIDLSGYKVYTRYVYGSTLASVSTARLFYTGSLSDVNITYDTKNSRLALTYERSSSQYVKIASISGSTYTWGSETTVLSSSTSCKGMEFDANSGKVIFAIRKDNNIKLVSGSISGTSITIGSPTTTLPTTAYYYDICFDNSSGRLLLMGGTSSSTNYYTLCTVLPDGTFGFSTTTSLSEAEYTHYTSAYRGRILYHSQVYGNNTKLRLFTIS